MMEAGIDLEVFAKHSPFLYERFARYTGRYLRRNFHAVRLLNGVDRAVHPAADRDTPLVILCNHPSWNDVMVSMYLSHCLFPYRQHIVAMDADALEGYGFFKRIGFFGVRSGSVFGGRQFLRTAEATFARGGVLWITGQGEFTDVRVRPTKLQSGVGHALSRTSHEVTVLPLALEYCFGEERHPEVFLAFGEPLSRLKTETRCAEQWTNDCASALESAQDRLAEAVIARDADQFEVLLDGSVGVGGVYGGWKWLRAKLQGQSYDPRHGSLTSK